MAQPCAAIPPTPPALELAQLAVPAQPFPKKTRQCTARVPRLLLVARTLGRVLGEQKTIRKYAGTKQRAQSAAPSGKPCSNQSDTDHVCLRKQSPGKSAETAGASFTQRCSLPFQIHKRKLHCTFWPFRPKQRNKLYQPQDREDIAAHGAFDTASSGWKHGISAQLKWRWLDEACQSGEGNAQAS